jgi:hypothetical protein
METNKPLRITGEIFFATDMVEFNQFTEDKQQYVAQIGKLSSAAVDKLREMGINVGENELKGLNISCKSKFKHTVFDENGNEIDPKTIGNGTKCVALVGTYDWKFGKKTGKAASLKKLIVTDLVKYEPNSKQEETFDDVL